MPEPISDEQFAEAAAKTFGTRPEFEPLVAAGLVPSKKHMIEVSGREDPVHYGSRLHRLFRGELAAGPLEAVELSRAEFGMNYDTERGGWLMDPNSAVLASDIARDEADLNFATAIMIGRKQGKIWPEELPPRGLKIPVPGVKDPIPIGSRLHNLASHERPAMPLPLEEAQLDLLRYPMVERDGLRYVDPNIRRSGEKPDWLVGGGRRPAERVRSEQLRASGAASPDSAGYGQPPVNTEGYATPQPDLPPAPLPSLYHSQPDAYAQGTGAVEGSRRPLATAGPWAAHGAPGIPSAPSYGAAPTGHPAPQTTSAPGSVGFAAAAQAYTASGQSRSGRPTSSASSATEAHQVHQQGKQGRRR
ncbi:hypothetical protein ACQEU8_04160 [Streptomyces sp. CA-250714]|uniref:hypothetical protein n=1 Tax=Streptomyces sp. CA-250714 TaxID=3240060 RepID=UPI003D8B1BFA